MVDDRNKKNKRRRRICVKNTDGKDRLSDLPDAILIHILSLLEFTRYAVRTSVLSKRWRNLWTQVPVLHLSNLKFGQKADRFIKFIYMVLSRYDPNVKVESFRFRWVLRKTIPQQLLDMIHSFAQLHRVQHFSLCINTMRHRHANYPSKSFNPTSLTSLHLNLSGWYFNSGPFHDDCSSNDNVSFLQHRYLSDLITCNTLQTLCLENFRISSDKSYRLDMFTKLVNLTDLCLVGCYITGRDRYLTNICAPKLERLTILDKLLVFDKHSAIGHCRGLRISSSKLKYFRIDIWTSDFTICNQPVLEDLEINLHVYWMAHILLIDRHFVINLINALHSLSNAKSATLSETILQVNNSCIVYDFHFNYDFY